MLHARLPERQHIETDPDVLDEHRVYGYGAHDEYEVPISYRSPVHITGVSWRPGGQNEHWRSHDLKKPMEMKAMRKQAHDATENQDVRHCPFDGSGKIIGRADGSIECEFGGHYFTVQVQPQYPNFPQTMNGMPISIPGMPGQVETPSGVGPAGQDLGQGSQEGVPSDLDEGDDQTEDTEDTQAEPPPFAKASFKTMTGARLGADDYVRHLAIHLATDRGAMIERIRDERER